MQRKQLFKVAEYFLTENRPLQIIEIQKYLHLRNLDVLQEQMDVLTFQGIVSQLEFRGKVYYVLTLPYFGTSRFRDGLVANIDAFLAKHYSELIIKIGGVADGLCSDGKPQAHTLHEDGTETNA